MGAAVFVPWATLLAVGGWLVGIGLAFGVPTGVVYHVQLYRALAPRDALPKGWIWRPLDYHNRLRPTERRSVLPWCYTGAVGFGVISLGMISMALAVVAVIVRGV